MEKRQPTYSTIKKQIFERDKFTCQKCRFKGISDELETHHIIMKVHGGKDNQDNLITLCSICHYYSPDDEKEFNIYLEEKIDGNILNTFRKSQKSISKRTKKGLDKRAREGYHVTRAPFGYKLEEKKLIPKEDSYVVRELFQE